MANWADVDFCKPTRSRRMHDVLSFATDFLMLWDFLASLACGQIANAVCRARLSADEAVGAGTATCVPEIVLGSLVLALALRDPLAKVRRNGGSICYWVYRSERRCLFAFGSIMMAVVATEGWQLLLQCGLIAWLCLFATVLGTTRWGFGTFVYRLERSGALREAVAIIGATEAGERLAVRIAAEADIVGFYEALPDCFDPLDQNEMAELQELGASGHVDSVVVAIEKNREQYVSSLVEQLKILPVQVAICAEAQQPSPAAPESRFLGGVPIEVVAQRPINRRDFLIKTIFDKVAACVLLCLLLPLMAIIAMSIALSSKGPVIFRQRRQGWCGTHFAMLKFRTMHHTPHTGERCFQTRRHDSRCTRVGRVLRKTSLDELPQLWNVIRGEMSLVGPRPHAEMLDESDQAGRNVVGEYAQRHRVKPGITGWAQIHGSRGATTDVEQLRRRVAYDLHYIEHWSPWIDMEILLRTPFCLFGKNVF